MGVFAVIVASVLWGTTETAASFAKDLSPFAIGAFAMGIAALLLGLRSARPLVRRRKTLIAKPSLGTVIQIKDISKADIVATANELLAVAHFGHSESCCFCRSNPSNIDSIAKGKNVGLSGFSMK